MAEIRLRVPDRLAAVFKDYAAKRGGKSKAVQKLIRDALSAGSPAVAERVPRCAEEGDSRGIMVKLDRKDFVELDRHVELTGMLRSEWIRSCLRRRLFSANQFNRYDRARLRQIVVELRQLRLSVSRAGKAFDSEQARRSVVDAIGRIEKELAAALRENRSYWQTDQSGP